MADAVTSQTLVDGTRTAVMKFTNISDGNSNSKLTLTDFGGMEINILAKDSTNWLIWGYTEGADAPAFADN